MRFLCRRGRKISWPVSSSSSRTTATDCGVCPSRASSSSSPGVVRGGRDRRPPRIVRYTQGQEVHMAKKPVARLAFALALLVTALLAPRRAEAACFYPHSRTITYYAYIDNSDPTW